MKKRSFFERLTGAINTEGNDQFFDDSFSSNTARSDRSDKKEIHIERKETDDEMRDMAAPSEEDAQLTVDMYQTPDDIVVRTIVAGVNPQELDVTITREMVTISGRREEAHEVEEEDYFHKELYWGSFSRTILLPEEVDVEMAEAVEKHGVLTIRLPKVDKQRKTKLSVKSG